jgi:nickel-dependent lactate racemase
MSPRALLAYGATGLEIELPPGSQVVDPPTSPPPRPVSELLEGALAAPIAAEPLERAVRRGDRVLAIVSDATRADPRAAFLEAIRARLPSGASLGVAVANGTHAPAPLASLRLPAWATDVVNHDSRDARHLVEIGCTRRGTPLRVHRCLGEADWVVATGCIRPHYFAGYGAGSKAIFPGLGENDAIRRNHELKTDPRARAGVVEGNPCRDDLEEILEHLAARTFLLNLAVDVEERGQAAVSGDVRVAFRAGAAWCEPFFRVSAPPSSLIVVSDTLPVAGSLYQASKLVAAVAPVARGEATIVLAVPAAAGVEPVEVVNRAIYEIGLRPRLPPAHRIVLVSDLPASAVAPSYCEYASSVEEVLEGRPAIVFPRKAAYLLIDPGTEPAPEPGA